MADSGFKPSSKRSVGESLKASFTDDPVARKVLKATDSSDNPPKEKHLEAILEFSHRRDVPIPEMCEAIAGRLASPKWMVALKAQLTLHMLLRDGGERLMRYFSTRSGLLPTANFNDTRGLDAVARSQFIRGYSAHLQRKSETYLKLGYEWNQASASSKRDVIKTLNGTELNKTFVDLMDTTDILFQVAAVQDSAVAAKGARGDFSVSIQTSDHLNLQHPLLRGAMRMLLKDALRIYVFANDAAVCLLEKYFKLPKFEAGPVYKIYERYAHQCEALDAFVDRCRELDVLDGKNIPRLSDAPKSILPTMAKIFEDK